MRWAASKRREEGFPDLDGGRASPGSGSSSIRGSGGPEVHVPQRWAGARGMPPGPAMEVESKARRGFSNSAPDQSTGIV